MKILIWPSNAEEGQIDRLRTQGVRTSYTQISYNQRITKGQDLKGGTGFGCPPSLRKPFEFEDKTCYLVEPVQPFLVSEHTESAVAVVVALSGVGQNLVDFGVSFPRPAHCPFSSARLNSLRSDRSFSLGGSIFSFIAMSFGRDTTLTPRPST